MLFWLFLGGFVWVIGDLLQQFAVKYLGIGRGIPLSNTNQLWGLAWGALVFGELAHADFTHKLLVISGSLVMVLGALSISSAVAGQGEHSSNSDAVLAECNRYKLDDDKVLAEFGVDTRRGLIVNGHVPVKIEAGESPMKRSGKAITIDGAFSEAYGDHGYTLVLSLILVVALVACAWALWRSTKFS